MDAHTIAQRLREVHDARPLGAAVVVPLIPYDDGFEVLFELRASDIQIQPAEVCLPGGHIETGETPLEAALREVEEELLVSRSQLEVLSELDGVRVLSGAPFHAFVGVLEGYEGSFDAAEVARTFTVPLDYFLATQPTVFSIGQHMEFPDSFPFDRIPGGRSYPWRTAAHEVPFYLETNPLIWGLTARVMQRFASLLR